MKRLKLMVNLQRSHLQVSDDYRRQPRFEFQLPVSIMEIEARATILDFSLHGFYIQVDCVSYFKKSQALKLALRFPGEKNPSMIRVGVARIDKHGIGCEFIDLDPATKELVHRKFEIFSCTLPIQ